MRLLRPHPVVWLQKTMRLWWPFFVAIASVCLIATMTYVTWTVVDERKYFEQEQARDERQDRALADLLEAQQADDEQSAVQVAQALAEAERLLADTFAAHDENVALKLNEMLARIEALLGRPAGTAPNPVHAVGQDGSAPPAEAHSPAPRAAPSPSPRSVPTPPTTTATTTPDQRSCAKRPTGPRC